MAPRPSSPKFLVAGHAAPAYPNPVPPALSRPATQSITFVAQKGTSCCAVTHQHGEEAPFLSCSYCWPGQDPNPRHIENLKTSAGSKARPKGSSGIAAARPGATDSAHDRLNRTLLLLARYYRTEILLVGLDNQSLRILAELRRDLTDFPNDPTDNVVDSVMAINNDDAAENNSMGDILPSDAPTASDLHGDEAVVHALRNLLDPR